MRSDREHRIPLSDAACALLRAVKGDRNPAPDELIFRGQKGAITKQSFLEIARRVAAKMSPPIGETEISAHGFRSSFRTWGGEETSFAREILEVALSHRVGDSKTEVAYARGALLEKRRAAMQAWGAYVLAQPTKKSAKLLRVV